MEFEVEHVNPRVRGGVDDLFNLALARGSCNRRKAQATRALDAVTGDVVLLFNPRHHDWGEHFECDPLTCAMVGRTATGRATVERLDLNRRQMIRARLLWGVNGWYPP